MILCFTLLLVSCSTVPKISLPADSELAEFSLLPAGGMAYLWVDVEQGRPLIDVLSLDGRSLVDAAPILDRTNSAVAVIYPLDPGTEHRFFLAASGSYPRRSANFSLGFSREWKRQRSITGNRYWYSAYFDLAIALGSDIAFASDSDPFVVLSRSDSSVIMPQGFLEFHRPMALAGWLNNPKDAIDTFLESIALPIQIPAEDFFFGAARLPMDHPSTDELLWELSFRIRVSSERDARAFSSGMNLALLLFRRGAALRPILPSGSMNLMDFIPILFANNLEQDGEYITLKTAPMDENRIALLFSVLQVYSK